MAAKKDEDMTPLNARIPTDLHKLLRIEAINRGERVQDLVAAALRKFLGEPGSPPADAKPRKPR